MKLPLYEKIKCIPGESGLGLEICSTGVTLRTGFCGLLGFDSEDFRRFEGLPVKLLADSGRFKPEVVGMFSSPVLLTL